MHDVDRCSLRAYRNRGRGTAMKKPAADTAYIIFSILGIGVALWAFTVPEIRAIHDEQQEVRKDISALGERIARIEGLLEGYTARSGETG